MPMSMLKLRPGVNVEVTASQLEAGYSVSNLGRFRNGLFEKLGGWLKYYAFAVGGIPKCLHAWLDLNENQYLAVGTTTILGTINDDDLTILTPQTYTSNIAPHISTTVSSTTVTLFDTNISNVTTLDSIEFKTPVAVGGLILSGGYPIDLVLSATSYQITAANVATSTQANATITAITQANPGAVTTSGAHGFSTGQLIYIYGVVGMTQVNGVLFSITSTGANTFTLGVNTTAYTAYSSAGTASPAAVPRFTTISGDSFVSVTLQAHGLSTGDTINFPISTSVGGLTILGTYSVTSVTDANTFKIAGVALASSAVTAFMNSGNVELLYYIAIGPVAGSTGYSVGPYSAGGYSTGSTVTPQTGTPITATDWSLDNWGQTLLACPDGGGLYAWTPGQGRQTAQLIAGAPLFNTGMFISMQTQMAIMYGSTDEQNIGLDQDPLLVKWSAQGDYTDFTISTTTQAGSRRLPQGSKIVGGLSVPNAELLWTDLDLWQMSYLGSLAAGVWGFNKIGANCGLIGKHAAVKQGSNIYWMGISKFWVTGGAQPQEILCTVWDTVFQDLNTAYQHKCWAWSNSPFAEIWFFYPRASTNAAEPDAFVKFNVRENVWDYGPMGRTCGIDQSLLGMPIAATSGGIIYEHETSFDADGQPINSYFESGWFQISDGLEISFLDWLLPDAIWQNTAGTSTSATLLITLYSAYYPGGTVTTHGPYTVTQSTAYINPRLRGRLAKYRIESNDLGSFWRLGGHRSRIAADGRL